jgi:hypothetical protein
MLLLNFNLALLLVSGCSARVVKKRQDPDGNGFKLQDVDDTPFSIDIGPLSAFSAVNIEGHTKYLTTDAAGAPTWTASDVS